MSQEDAPGRGCHEEHESRKPGPGGVRNETGIQQQVKNKIYLYNENQKTQSQKSTSWHTPMARSSLPRRAEQRPASAEPAGQRGGEKAINSRR